MKRIWGAVIGLIGVTFAGAALAESVKMHGDFPADNRQASYLQDMSVEPIDGPDGRLLEMDISRRLTDTRHFTVFGGGGGRGSGDEGAISGMLTTDILRNRVDLMRNVCVAKDPKGNCTKKENRKLPCMRRSINLRADLQVMRQSDGSVVDNFSSSKSSFLDHCPGDPRLGGTESIIRDLVGQIAGEFVGSITPSSRDYSVRFRETRKGMPKDVGDRFKDAIRMTKRDVPSACREFEAINQVMPGNASVVFNMALCAESRGELKKATALYSDSSRLMGGRNNMGDEGLDRIRRLEAGREDWARFRSRR